MRKINLIVFLMTLVFSAAHCQQLQRNTVASSGSFLFTGGVLIRQTIGQPFPTQTQYTEDISFRPGFQQPGNKIKIGKSLISISLTPNPASDFVVISSPIELEKVTFTIYDNFGKLLHNQFFEKFTHHQFDCSKYTTGLYLVNLVTSKQQLNTSKLLIY